MGSQRVRGGQDFGSALLLIAIGAVGLWFGREYDLGSMADMGPGFVPTCLSAIIVVLGIVIGARALLREGPRIDPVRWRAVLFVALALIVFAGLLATAGLAPAVFLSTLVAAQASPELRWKESLPLAVGLTVVCVLVFVYALRQPIAVFGAG